MIRFNKSWNKFKIDKVSIYISNINPYKIKKSGYCVVVRP